MFRWTTLNGLPEYDCLSKKLMKAVQELNAEISQLLANREKLDEEHRKKQTADVVELDFDAMQFDRSAITLLLQTEVKLRRRYSDLFEQMAQELGAAASKAHEDYEAALTAIREALVAIGYVDANTYDATPGKITPGMLNGHPRVIAARERARELTSHSHARELAIANDARILEVQNQLAVLRNRAVAF